MIRTWAVDTRGRVFGHQRPDRQRDRRPRVSSISRSSRHLPFSILDIEPDGTVPVVPAADRVGKRDVRPRHDIVHLLQLRRHSRERAGQASGPFCRAKAAADNGDPHHASDLCIEVISNIDQAVHTRRSAVCEHVRGRAACISDRRTLRRRTHSF